MRVSYSLFSMTRLCLTPSHDIDESDATDFVSSMWGCAPGY